MMIFLGMLPLLGARGLGRAAECAIWGNVADPRPVIPRALIK